MDLKGQILVEKLFLWLSISWTILCFLAGYLFQDISITFHGYLIGESIVLLVRHHLSRFQFRLRLRNTPQESYLHGQCVDTRGTVLGSAVQICVPNYPIYNKHPLVFPPKPAEPAGPTPLPQ